MTQGYDILIITPSNLIGECQDEHVAFIFRVQVSKVKGYGTQSRPSHTVHRQCDTRFVRVEWSYAYKNLCSK